MDNEKNLANLLKNRVVSIDIIEKIADAQAYELWGENIGRGESIPLSDEKGVYAYIFPYILGSKHFPSFDRIFYQVRFLKDKYKVSMEGENIPEAYYSELRQFGSGFGSVCVSVKYSDTPILWISHFLDMYFIIGESAKEEAVNQLGEDITLINYYYLSPEEQYMQFSSGAKEVMIDACSPAKDVPDDVLMKKSSNSKSNGIDSEISDLWEKLTGNSFKSIQAGVSLDLAPGTDITPIGLQINDSPQIMKKIENWELIPPVDHTTKNWCVPTSWAMILGFYDNYVKGKGTNLGYGRLIDYWYELKPNGPNLPNLIDDLLSPQGASKINKYSFKEERTEGDQLKLWEALKSEIDAGKPCFCTTPSHCTVAFGYHENNNGEKFAIVYDPANPSTPTYIAEYNLQGCDGIGALSISGGTKGENMIIIEPDGNETAYTSVPTEIVWFIWGNSIKKTRLSISEDGGNKWQTIADNIPTNNAWNSYTWIPGNSGTRFRVKVEGNTDANELVAADGSFHNFNIQPQVTGGSWKKIFGPVGMVIAGYDKSKGTRIIYATELDTGDIYQFMGKPAGAFNWLKVGGPGKMFVLDGQGQLYGLSPDGNGIFKYSGTGTKWVQIGGPAKEIYGDVTAYVPLTLKMETFIVIWDHHLHGSRWVDRVKHSELI